MDLRALNYFAAVYETGSLSAASKACYVAQPSISASIKQLEQSLEQTLFTRHSKGVKATNAGHQLYPLAKQLLGQAGAIQKLFKQGKEKLPFRLGLIKGLGVERMSRLLKDFTSALDNLELILVEQDEKCDARIISLDMCRKQEEFLPMWQEEYILALPVNHPLALRNSLKLKELQAQAFVHRLSCGVWPLFQEQLNMAGINIDIRANIQTIEYAIGLVRAGVGAALLPAIQHESEPRDIVYRKVQGVELRREIGLAYESDSYAVDVLKAIIQEN